MVIQLISSSNLLHSLVGCSSELRHAVKRLIHSSPVKAITLSTSVNYKWTEEYIGLRIAQLATGAHYKLCCLLPLVDSPCDILCGGDGSGGMGAALLRFYPASKLIFNSLMAQTNNSFLRVHLGPPSAVSYMNENVKIRKRNLTANSGINRIPKMHTRFLENWMSIGEEYERVLDFTSGVRNCLLGRGRHQSTRYSRSGSPSMDPLF